MATDLGGEPTADMSDMDILNSGGEEDASQSGGEGTETPEAGAGEETPPAATGEEDPAEPAEVKDPAAGDEEEDPEKGEEDKRANSAETTELAKKLKTEFPEMFKKYPEVRKALFQADQYTQVFPTVDEARDAADKSEVFDAYEQQLMTGDPSVLFKSLASAGGPEVFEKFAMNLLPTIETFSPKIQAKMVFPYIHRILNNALNDARGSENKNLEHGIGWLSKYLWGKVELPELAKETEKTENPEVSRLKQQNEVITNRLSAEFNDGVVTGGLKELRTSIEMTFKNDKRFSSIEKKALTDDIIHRTRKALDKDARHNKVMSMHWQKARAEGHPKALIPRVTNAFLGGAKSLMPTIRGKVLAEALREKGIIEAPKGNVPGTPQTGGPQTGSRGVTSKNIDYSKTSDADILSGDNKRIALKKR